MSGCGTSGSRRWSTARRGRKTRPLGSRRWRSMPVSAGSTRRINAATTSKLLSERRSRAPWRLAVSSGRTSSSRRSSPMWTGRATTKPAIVQNRCFAAMGWDRAVRQFCNERDILYQGFSLLTANREALSDRRVHEIASRAGRTVPQVIFRFALQVGMSALTGTTSAAHMREDLGVYDFELQPDEVRTLDGIGAL